MKGSGGFWTQKPQDGPGPNRNRKPQPSEPFFPGTGGRTGTAGTVFQEPKPEPEPSLSDRTLLKHRETTSPREPSEPKTRTAGTVPCTNRNRAEPNRGHPLFLYFVRSFEKGLADRGGWREEILERPEIQAPFAVPFSYAPRGEGGLISGEFPGSSGGFVCRQPPPANPFSKPLIWGDLTSVEGRRIRKSCQTFA